MMDEQLRLEKAAHFISKSESIIDNMVKNTSIESMVAPRGNYSLIKFVEKAQIYIDYKEFINNNSGCPNLLVYSLNKHKDNKHRLIWTLDWWLQQSRVSIDLVREWVTGSADHETAMANMYGFITQRVCKITDIDYFSGIYTNDNYGYVISWIYRNLVLGNVLMDSVSMDYEYRFPSNPLSTSLYNGCTSIAYLIRYEGILKVEKDMDITKIMLNNDKKVLDWIDSNHDWITKVTTITHNVSYDLLSKAECINSLNWALNNKYGLVFRVNDPTNMLSGLSDDVLSWWHSNGNLTKLMVNPY